MFRMTAGRESSTVAFLKGFLDQMKEMNKMGIVALVPLCSAHAHAVLALHAIREQRRREGLELNPRTCAGARAHHCKYLRWFALPADTACNAFLRLRSFRLLQVRRVLQFWIGCH